MINNLLQTLNANSINVTEMRIANCSAKPAKIFFLTLML